MPHTPDGVWYPNLFGKGFDLFNSKARAHLASGPSLSGKSFAVGHKLARHLWDTNRARMAFFSRTIKTSKEGGAWSLFNEYILPEWIKADIGMNYTTVDNTGTPGPKVSGITRTPFLKVRNAHGTESECYLFSLDYVQDIEKLIKEQSFSCIYFSELDKFNDRKVLSVCLPRLRMPHLKFEEHLWIADTNPAEDGDESWIYKVWYQERTMKYDDYLVYCADEKQLPMDKEPFEIFQRGLALTEMFPEENPFLSKQKLDELKAQYSYDPILYARYVKGQWVFHKTNETFHFRGTFNEAVHVVGDASSKNEDDWECINPSPACVDVVTGWDLGDVNHAAVALEPIQVGNRKCFTVLDELEVVGENVSIEDFTVEFTEICSLLERLAGRPLNFERSWSDTSSLEKYNAAADTFQYLVVAAASNNRFMLQGVEKSAGSVAVRVQLLKQLLASGRIKISAHCKAVIRMLKNLKKGKGRLNYVIGSDKHIFDALTYALIKECAEELEAIVNQFNSGSGNRKGASFNIQV
jgi:hypothetical protein